LRRNEVFESQLLEDLDISFAYNVGYTVDAVLSLHDEKLSLFVIQENI